MNKNDGNRTFVTSNKITHLLCLLLCALFVFALVGCNNKEIDKLRDDIAKLQEESSKLQEDNSKLHEEIENMKNVRQIYELNETATIYDGPFPVLTVTLTEAKANGSNGKPQLTFTYEEIGVFPTFTSMFFGTYGIVDGHFNSLHMRRREDTTVGRIVLKNVLPEHDHVIVYLSCDDYDGSSNLALIPGAIFHFTFS